MSSLEVLDFPRVREIVAGLCRTPVGQELARAMGPVRSRDWVESELDCVGELCTGFTIPANSRGVRFAVRRDPPGDAAQEECSGNVVQVGFIFRLPFPQGGVRGCSTQADIL